MTHRDPAAVGARRRRPHGAALGVALAVALVAGRCNEDESILCEGAICPAGSTCNIGTGMCEPVDAPPPVVGELGRWSSVVALFDGVLIATYDRTHGALLVLEHAASGETSQPQRVDGGALAPGGVDAGAYPSLALDTSGRPHVAYYDRTNRVLKVARRSDSGGWLTEVIDDGGVEGADVGRWASLVIDGADGRHFAYRDETRRRLILRSPGPEGCRATQAPPSGAPVSNDHGQWASIGITNDGALVVSFYDAGRGNLMLATCKGSDLRYSILDGEEPDTGQDTGDVGRWSSLAVDADGNASVAYFDATRGVLKLARSSQGQIEISVVDDGLVAPGQQHLVGQQASLAFGAQGRARIAYLDVTGRAVKLARLGELQAWTTTTLADTPAGEPGGVGLGLALAVDASDRAFVTFSRWTPADPEGESLVMEVVSDPDEAP